MAGRDAIVRRSRGRFRALAHIPARRIAISPPYSLTQRIVFNVGDSPIRSAFNRLDFTTQASEFSTPGQVPEPGTIPLMGLGLMGLLAIARRKKV